LPRTVFYAPEWNRLEIIQPQTGDTIDVLTRDWLHLSPYLGLGGPFIFNPERADMTPYPLIILGIEVLFLIAVVGVRAVGRRDAQPASAPED